MYTTGTIQILEGVVGSLLGTGQINEPQALTGWLRAMKENINYMGKNIENAFVIDVLADPDDTEDTIQASDTWLLGFVARSMNTVAEMVEYWDVATPTPGTTATGTQASLYLPAAAATTPAVGGLVYFPFEFFDTTCLVSVCAVSDYATGSGTNLANVWSVRRDE